MIASTAKRVSAHTAPAVNKKIRRRTEDSVAACAEEGLDAINRRLAELDREWDVERCIGTIAPIGTLVGTMLGLSRSKKWFALPVAINSFLVQHSIQGWCPPLVFLRRLGVRTQEEINQERYALKALRGDFQKIRKPSRSKSNRATAAMKANSQLAVISEDQRGLVFFDKTY